MLTYCFEDTPFTLDHSEELNPWIEALIQEEGHELAELSYIFCSDDYLLEINKTYLQHDYYTDVITFDHSEEDHLVEGDIFISVERVHENSQNFQEEFWQELYRVMAHGVLHLLGYQDKSKQDTQTMRAKEDYYLSKAPHRP